MQESVCRRGLLGIGLILLLDPSLKEAAAPARTVLAAAGYNFRLLLRWLALVLQLILAALTRPSHPNLPCAQP